MGSTNTVRRIAIAFLLFTLGFAVGCTDDTLTDSTLQAVGGPTVTTDQTTYAPNAAITASWSGTSGAENDWIALVAAGSPANSGFLQYTFTNGAVSGMYAFAGLPTGNYEARLYGAGTYTILSTATFSVGSGSSGGPVTVTTDKAIYQASTPITVNWMGTSGNPNDWIAITPAGSPANSGFIAYTFTGGMVDGSHVFAGLQAGNYEARAYQNGTYTIVGSKTFSVTDLTIDHPTYTVNQPVTVTWVNLPGSANDFVSINAAGSAANAGFVQQFVTAGAVNGSHQFSGLPAGSYEARSYKGGGFTVLATVAFTVSGTSPPGPTVSTTLANYTPGSPITVTWSGLPSNTNDWISLSTAGSPPNSGFVSYTFTNGAAAGSFTFGGIGTEGNYEVRAYQGGSYTILASSPFTVSASGGNGCVPPTNPPVVGSITSGDLVLDSTHNVNSIALTANLTTSVLFTSTRENEPSPAYGAVMCNLHDVDSTDMLPAGLTCRRTSVGTDTGTGTVTVHYSVVTFTSGVSVQRGTANTGFNNPSVVTINSVSPSQSFVLLNGMTNGGSGWGSNEFVRAQLVDATTLNLRTGVAGTTVSWQVVTMSGASVQRGTSAFATGDVQQSVTIPTVPTGSMVLASYTTDNASAIASASLMMQSSLSSPTTVLLSRDLGGAALDVSWEVVSLPFATHFGLTSFAAGESARTEAVTGIAAASSVGVCSSQSILGQATGSTMYNGADVDLVGEAAVTLATGAGSLTVTRGTSQAAAEIPWTVIDFAHNCNGL